MTIEDPFESRKLQIECAAIGCVSGTLSEWPHLLSALRHFGKKADGTMFALTAKVLAQEVCEEQGWTYGIKEL